MTTPHIDAIRGDFSDTVIIAGDPLRVRYIAETYFENGSLVTGAAALLLLFALAGAVSAEPATRHALFGDLHVHSSNSFDAYVGDVRAGPEQAFRFGRGEKIPDFSGEMIQLRTPLDFMAVTDHAKYLGVLPGLDDPALGMTELQVAIELRSSDPAVRRRGFERFLYPGDDPDQPVPAAFVERRLLDTWAQTVELAEHFNEPGRFTTFAGYEWTAAPSKQGLHRNVIFRSSKVPERPFSAEDSENPEDLWRWMDALRAAGIELLAIPHNGNLSNGLMFPRETWSGAPVDDAWSRQRLRNEPIVEMTQVKGTSETHPALSPDDAFAGFEILDELMGLDHEKSQPKGGYVRDAYRLGLQLAEEGGINPYRFGVIGSSDGHNAASPVEEDNYFGKIADFDGTPERRRTGTSGIARHAYLLSAAGLAGVWAETNSREAIFAALERKETFATSGTRIRLRFFAGWDYPDELPWQPDWVAHAYAAGVPMGGTLGHVGSTGAGPVFVAQAAKDAGSAWLDRLQVIKLWVDAKGSHERTYDVACADGGRPEPHTRRCPPSPATVDQDTCDYASGSGDVEFLVRWRDPDFNAGEHAAYYLRVLENPTCRWSTWDAIRNGWPLLDDVPPTIQERAWSSPIWYEPKARPSGRIQ